AQGPTNAHGGSAIRPSTEPQAEKIKTVVRVRWEGLPLLADPQGTTQLRPALTALVSTPVWASQTPLDLSSAVRKEDLMFQALGGNCGLSESHHRQEAAGRGQSLRRL